MAGMYFSKGFKDCPGVLSAFFSEAWNEVHHHLKEGSFCCWDLSAHEYGAILLTELLAGSPVWNSSSSSPTVSAVHQLSRNCTCWNALLAGKYRLKQFAACGVLHWDLNMKTTKTTPISVNFPTFQSVQRMQSLLDMPSQLCKTSAGAASEQMEPHWSLAADLRRSFISVTWGRGTKSFI